MFFMHRDYGMVRDKYITEFTPDELQAEEIVNICSFMKYLSLNVPFLSFRCRFFMSNKRNQNIYHILCTKCEIVICLVIYILINNI